MGLDLEVPGDTPSFPSLLARLAERGLTCTVAMVDKALVMPNTQPPADWSEVRLRTPAGMVTLIRRPGAVRILVFGNADAGLIEAQRTIAAAIADG